MSRAVWFQVSPEGAKAVSSLYHFVSKGTALPDVLTHLVFLRVSQINGCAHCIDIHTRDLLAEGMSVEKLVLVPVWQEAKYLFTDKERAALAWAEEVTQVTETHASDEAYAAALEEFGEKKSGGSYSHHRSDECDQSNGNKLSHEAPCQGIASRGLPSFMRYRETEGEGGRSTKPALSHASMGPAH